VHFEHFSYRHTIQEIIVDKNQLSKTSDPRMQSRNQDQTTAEGVVMRVTHPSQIGLAPQNIAPPSNMLLSGPFGTVPGQLNLPAQSAQAAPIGSMAGMPTWQIPPALPQALPVDLENAAASFSASQGSLYRRNISNSNGIGPGPRTPVTATSITPEERNIAAIDSILDVPMEELCLVGPHPHKVL
jgi:hypothetical protein